MSGRPVYVPSRKRKTKRFHGAFTGGFSAGYFNTVGSAEGWTPREQKDDDEQEEGEPDVATSNLSKVKKGPQQSIHDIMDEEDYNQWGGPTGVKEEYEAKPSSSTLSTASTSNPLIELVSPPSYNVGHRLMRILGWRDGSTTAYVASSEGGDTIEHGLDANKKALLSQKRLKKIQLQQSRVQIPPPKQDTCGLGYEAYHDAPEFQRDRERRRRLAQQRAKAVTANEAADRNVYRMANVLGDVDEDIDEKALTAVGRRRDNGEGDHEDGLTSFETVQDFVGSKTVGGFALREDDDDVYDDHHISTKVNLDEYDTELHDHHSDVEDEAHEQTSRLGPEAFGSVLASWATARDDPTKSEHAPTSRGITSDGRPPLPGFVLGGTTVSSQEPGQKRFPGPDLPINYEPKRHVFGPDEYPGSLQRESRDERFEEMERRRRAAAVERKAREQKFEKERAEARSKPMASGAFAGLAAAMKSRFTSETTDEDSTRPVGMQKPSAVASRAAADTSAPVAEQPRIEKKVIKITRTILPFAPESLLCKRLNVPPPSNALFASRGGKPPPSGSEAAFFEREVLASARSSQPPKEEVTDKQRGLQQDDDEEVEGDDVQQRPSMKILSSIFEPSSSDEESEGPESDELETQDVSAVPKSEEPIDRKELEPASGVTLEHAELESEQMNGVPPNEASETKPENAKRRRDRSRSPSDDDSSAVKGNKKPKDEDKPKKRRRERSRSPSDTDSSSTDDRRRRRRRRKRREEKKKRKKKHKSRRKSSIDDS